MDWDNLISSVGFPIVAFMIVYMDLRKLVQRNTESIEALKDAIIGLYDKRI